MCLPRASTTCPSLRCVLRATDDYLIQNFIVCWPLQARLVKPHIQGVIAQCLVVGTDIYHNRQHLCRVETCKGTQSTDSNISAGQLLPLVLVVEPDCSACQAQLM